MSGFGLAGLANVELVLDFAARAERIIRLGFGRAPQALAGFPSLAAKSFQPQIVAFLSGGLGHGFTNGAHNSGCKSKRINTRRGICAAVVGQSDLSLL